MDANQLFTPQNIITILAIMGTALSVIISWRKLGEDRRRQMVDDQRKSQDDIIWKTRIEAKLEVMETKLDGLSRTEKNNDEAIRSLRDTVIANENKINRLDNDLKTYWQRLDELRIEVKESKKG